MPYFVPPNLERLELNNLAFCFYVDKRNEEMVEYYRNMVMAGQEVSVNSVVGKKSYTFEMERVDDIRITTFKFRNNTLSVITCELYVLNQINSKSKLYRCLRCANSSPRFTVVSLKGVPVGIREDMLSHTHVQCYATELKIHCNTTMVTDCYDCEKNIKNNIVQPIIEPISSMGSKAKSIIFSSFGIPRE